MIYLIAILAVLLLALYDYLRNKAAWTLKANIVKYAVCLGVAWFYAAVSSVAIFKDLEIAGIVVLAGMFTDIILKFLSGVWAWLKGLSVKK